MGEAEERSGGESPREEARGETLGALWVSPLASSLGFAADKIARVLDPNLLANAAFHGDLRQVEELVRAGADINAEGDHWNPLHAAIENSQPDAVRLLLRLGADVERPAEGWTPLAHALELEWDVASNFSPFRPPTPDVSAILIAHGANPNVSVPHYGQLLQWVSRLDYPAAVQMLIEAGARP
jgi:ankyrin repeat protein